MQRGRLLLFWNRKIVKACSDWSTLLPDFLAKRPLLSCGYVAVVCFLYQSSPVKSVNKYYFSRKWMSSFTFQVYWNHSVIPGGGATMKMHSSLWLVSHGEDARNRFYFSDLYCGNSFYLFTQKWWRKLIVINRIEAKSSLTVRLYSYGRYHTTKSVGWVKHIYIHA